MTPNHALDNLIAITLDQMATENATYARNARLSDEKDAAMFFQRSANSFAKALRYWLDGVRPEQTPAGNWLIPSQRGPTEPPHLLRMDGDWSCTCSSGDQMHWAKAMIIAIQMTHDEETIAGMSGQARRDYEAACEALLDCYV